MTKTTLKGSTTEAMQIAKKVMAQPHFPEEVAYLIEDYAQRCVLLDKSQRTGLTEASEADLEERYLSGVRDGILKAKSGDANELLEEYNERLARLWDKQR